MPSKQKRNSGLLLSHLFFVKTLEGVLRILQLRRGSKGFIPPPGDRAKPGIVRETTVGGSVVADSVEHLRQEESTELDPEDPHNDTLGPDELPKPRRKAAYKVENLTDEMCFAVFCLLEDYHTIQTSLKKTWWNYKLGNLDLMTASVVTDTAFDRSDALTNSYAVPFQWPKTPVK